ncbi:capsular polysaccharide synthesis protein [Enterobacter sp.]|uniref:capsular polysaccharide synthesis protein n=1 Tax=Enterobacter sp. TaxID=42895 RepID=UPI003783950F
MNLNLINKLIKKTRRWQKKTGLSLFQRAAAHFEQKKKETLFGVIDALKIQPESASNTEPSQSRIIWICWFQGLESAPELVKRCIESVQRNTPDAQVVILTDDNIPDYLSLPEHIKTKYQAGLISKAQYSDIVRCSLLYQYGGSDGCHRLYDESRARVFSMKIASLRCVLTHAKMRQARDSGRPIFLPRKRAIRW